MSKPSLLQRLRYRLDNTFTSGIGFVWLMFLAMVFLAVVMTGVQEAIGSIGPLNEKQVGTGAYFEVFWAAFAKILSLGREPTWGERIVSVLYWAITIAVTGTVIGFITSRIQGLVAALRKGKSPVVESGHVLVLGWSPRVFPVLAELAVAAQNARGQLVVIFADREREQMQDEIASRASDLSALRVVLRRGDPTNPIDLARANVAGARSVIVLDSDRNGDAAVVSAVLAARTVAPAMTAPIIAEIDDAATAAALRSVTDGQVRPVRSQDVIAKVTAQATRQPGLGAVTLDLLNFEGDEIYFSRVPELYGRTYGEAIRSFPEASVLGIAAPDGAVAVNPPQDHVIAAGSAVVAIAADDDRVRYQAAGPAGHSAATPMTRQRPEAERILMIGWSRMGASVLEALAPFLAPGSSALIIAREEFVDESERSAPVIPGLEVTYTPISADIRELESIFRSDNFDEVIVLGYRSEISVADADAHTILTMLHISRMLALDPAAAGGAGPRLVAEILDSRKADLAKMARVDDLVVSDRLAALMIAQLAENPRLSSVFDELFDAGGAVIAIHPVDRYAVPGRETAFLDLVSAAGACGASAIGYRRGADGSVRLNPPKSQRFIPAPGDGLLVVGTAGA